MKKMMFSSSRGFYPILSYSGTAGVGHLETETEPTVGWAAVLGYKPLPSSLAPPLLGRHFPGTSCQSEVWSRKPLFYEILECSYLYPCCETPQTLILVAGIFCWSSWPPAQIASECSRCLLGRLVVWDSVLCSFFLRRVLAPPPLILSL